MAGPYPKQTNSRVDGIFFSEQGLEGWMGFFFLNKVWKGAHGKTFPGWEGPHANGALFLQNSKEQIPALHTQSP